MPVTFELSTEDALAREMSRLVYDKVVVIADTQQHHGRRLARIEATLDDHGMMLKEILARLPGSAQE